MSSIVARVLLRYRLAQHQLTAGSLPLGKTFQNELVRIHRYSNSLRVTDLTNAGKRGKKCDELTVMPTVDYEGDHDQWLARMAGLFLDQAGGGYRAIFRFIKDVQHDFPTEISIEVESLRGIDVEPFGEIFEFEIPQPNKAWIEVRVSPTDFRVINHAYMRHPTDPTKPGFIHDSRYFPMKREDAAAFYAWMKDNHARARRFMNMDMFRKTWQTLGVKYDYH